MSNVVPSLYIAVKKLTSGALACASALSGLEEGVSFVTWSSANPEKLPSSDGVIRIQMVSARKGTRPPQVLWIKCAFSCDNGSHPCCRTDWPGRAAAQPAEPGPAFLQTGVAVPVWSGPVVPALSYVSPSF